MKLAIFVHEFQLEVGHSRATIDLLNHLSTDQKEKIKEIKVIAYYSGNLDLLLPEIKCKKTIHQVPFKNLYPFFIKSIFYQLWTQLYSIIFLKEFIKLGIGMACMNIDIVNIQFIQKQYQDLALTNAKSNFLRYLYKTLLFSYYGICEDILFQKKNLQFLVPAKFLKTYLMDEYKIDNQNIALTYSGVDLKNFHYKYSTKNEVYTELCKRYDELKKLDISKPIYLFVGAFERKGLPHALEILKQNPEAQFLVVGVSESITNYKFPENLNVAWVKFTKEISLFYELADIFIFPTTYEPFGLVILEAYIMGLDLYVTNKNVGAMELISDFDHVYKIDKNFQLPKSHVIELKDKMQRREMRINNLSQYSWENSSQLFSAVLNKFK